MQVQGTSFSAPVVFGVVALMKSANAQLSRDRITDMIKKTASYKSLTMTTADANRYRLQAGFGGNNMYL